MCVCVCVCVYPLKTKRHKVHFVLFFVLHILVSKLFFLRWIYIIFISSNVLTINLIIIVKLIMLWPSPGVSCRTEPFIHSNRDCSIKYEDSGPNILCNRFKFDSENTICDFYQNWMQKLYILFRWENDVTRK